MNLTPLSTELYWLTLTILMTALFWIPYVVNRMLEQGILVALWDRFGVTDTNKNWANRMMEAHTNAIENLVLFALLVILIQVTGSTTATTCIVYFFARLLHYLVFTFSVPLLRVVTFLTGFVVQVVLAFTLLGA